MSVFPGSVTLPRFTVDVCPDQERFLWIEPTIDAYIVQRLGVYRYPHDEDAIDDLRHRARVGWPLDDQS